MHFYNLNNKLTYILYGVILAEVVIQCFRYVLETGSGPT